MNSPPRQSRQGSFRESQSPPNRVRVEVEGGKPTLYRISYRAEGHEMAVSVRYSEMLSFYKGIGSFVSLGDPASKRFPPKDFFGRYRPEVVERRRQYFECLVRDVISHPSNLGITRVRRFLNLQDIR